MALIPITNPGRVQKRDALDRVTQVLQLAGAGLAVPNAYYDLKAKRRADSGELTTAEAVKAGINLLPTPPPPASPGLTPPQSLGEPVAAPKPPPELSPMSPMRGSKVTVDGQERTALGPNAMDDSRKIAESYRKEFLGVIQPTIAAASGYKKVQAAKNNPAGHLAATFGFMKTIDPGSTVREGEVATVTNARGIPETIRNMYNSVVNGSRLTEAQLAQLKAEAGSQYQAQVDSVQPVYADYAKKAERMGLDPADVLFDLSTLSAGEAAAPAAPPVEKPTGLVPPQAKPRMAAPKPPAAPASAGLPPDKAKRLEELRAKKAAGTLK